MTPSSQSIRRVRVVIAGGGIAAAETTLALRALTGRALDVTMVAPTDRLHYRPLTVLEPFTSRATRHYPLDEICRDLGVALRLDTLTRVDADAGAVLTAAGERIGYDALVVATGARATVGLPRAHTFFADADPESLRWVVRDLQQGVVHRVAFVLPAGPAWTLPLYELALMTAARVRQAGVVGAQLTIVTPEDAPLALFHGAGSAVVADLLRAEGIEILTSAYAHDYDGAALEISPGGRALEAERVVALPVLRGPAIEGLPLDADGFVHVDEHGRVPGLECVFAVGDATTFPLKQGGIAAQQADVAAALIARAAGVSVPEPDARPRLRAVLFTGDGPVYLRATITGGESIVSTASRHCPWWPPQKIAARHLAPYLADRDEAAPAGASPGQLAGEPG